MKRRLPLAMMLAGLGVLYPMQRWIDSTTRRAVISEETLYFSSGETIKKMSFGLHGLLADIYWIRTVQYFGQKLLSTGRPLSSNTSEIRMGLLAPLLKIVVTLDPGHIRAYRFGAIFLPEHDMPAAIELLEMGIEKNPKQWHLYQDLGYIYWQSGDYARASEYYERGGEIEGAAFWMRDMAGLLKIKGGSRDVARQIYTRYLESEDPSIRNQAKQRLNQLKMLDELDAINALLAKYKGDTGSCPSSFRMLASRFRVLGLTLNQEMMPVDPDDYPYTLDSSTCTAKQALDSTVPR
jgi:tetratricopeptide (TPR) repeat protein